MQQVWAAIHLRRNYRRLTMAKLKLISRKQMDPEGEYSYCPFCRYELEEEGKAYKEFLQPLFRMVLAHWDDEVKREILTTQYECPRCKKSDMTVDTFIGFYCK